MFAFVAAVEVRDRFHPLQEEIPDEIGILPYNMYSAQGTSHFCKGDAFEAKVGPTKFFK